MLTVGCPKEIKIQENRVALTPSGAAQLVRRGVRVFVEANAGVGADYSDEEYTKAGAEIVDSAAALFDASQLIVKVKEPQPSELEMLRPDHVLFTYLHLAADKALTERSSHRGSRRSRTKRCRCGHRLPLLEPMSEVAGRMSIIMGAFHLAEHAGGRGSRPAASPQPQLASKHQNNGQAPRHHHHGAVVRVRKNHMTHSTTRTV